MRTMMCAVLAGAAGLATPAVAAGDLVAASDPAGIVKTLQDAGREAKLETDDYGDPIINTKFGEYGGSIYFYGCDETTHKGCDSVQFRAGLDRKTAMPLALLNSVVKKFRYAALWLDDDGDPWVNFDVFTGEGIPKAVFMKAFNAYADGLGTVADMVFEEERKR